MKKDLVNIALAVTAFAAIICLIFFFLKLDSIESKAGKDSKTTVAQSDGKDTEGAKKTGTSDTAKSSDVSKSSLGDLTGKNDDKTSKADKSDKSDKADKADPTSTPTPSPSPSPTPSPTPSPEPAYSGNIDPEKPIVALSYDDGPSSNTESILKTLEQYGAHATFFMVGENIDMYPERVKMVYDSGCEVANHTINHKNLNTLSASDIRKEVEGNQDKLNNTLGLDRKYIVRPPYGNHNETVRATVEHPMILWWVDTLDWKTKDPDSILEEVKKSTKDGAIILMHDLYKTTAEATKLVVPWLKEQGYQICSVSEMFAARGQKLEDGKVYNSAISAEKYKEAKNGSAQTST